MRVKFLNKDFFFIILIIILSFPAIKTLLIPGFFESHDGSFHLIRLAHFYQTLKEGHFPVRWAEDLNSRYGYPIFNFFYPLTYYLGSLLHFIGLNFGDSLKTIIFLSFTLSGIFTYLWIKSFFGRMAGFLAAMFYVYAPYRFVSAYVSGRMGEVTAYIFIPLCFYTLTKFCKKPTFGYLALVSLSYALLILSYNISALIFSPLFLSYGFFRLYQERQLSKATLLKFFLSSFAEDHGRETADEQLSSASADFPATAGSRICGDAPPKEEKISRALARGASFILLAYSLSAFFWIPALFERQYVKFFHHPIYDYTNNFPSLRAYLYHPWGYGFDTTGLAGGVSPQIGIPQIGVITLVFIFLVIKLYSSKKTKKRLSKKFWLALFFAFHFLIVFFIMNKISQPLWEILPFIKNTQFPFRFLSVVIFIASFFAGYLVKTLRKRILALPFTLCLLSLTFYANRNHLRPAYFERHPDSFYLGNNDIFYATTDVAAENTPIWNQRKLKTYGEKIKQDNKTWEKIMDIEIKPRFYSFRSVSQKEMKVRVNTFYYPGWKVSLDGKKIAICYPDEEGLIKFRLPPGQHWITVQFQDTTLRKLANLISLTSFLILLFLASKPILKKLKAAQKSLAKKFWNDPLGVL